MTIMTQPLFIDSKYVVLEPGNWHLTSDAPKKIVDEFNKWIKEYEKHKPVIEFNKGNNA